MAANQHHRSGHQAAAQYSVELRRAAGQTRQIFQADIGKCLHLTAHGPGIALLRSRASTAFNRWPQAQLHHTVPGVALAALTLPFAKLGTAFVADKGCFLLGHFCSSYHSMTGLTITLRPSPPPAKKLRARASRHPWSSEYPNQNQRRALCPHPAKQSAEYSDARANSRWWYPVFHSPSAKWKHPTWRDCPPGRRAL